MMKSDPLIQNLLLGATYVCFSTIYGQIIDIATICDVISIDYKLKHMGDITDVFHTQSKGKTKASSVLFMG